VRHRRRIALASGAAVLATVAAAGVGYGVVDANSRGLVPADTSSPLSPTATDSSRPSGEWMQDIPEDFPIATQLPDYGGDGRQVGPHQGLRFADFTVCGATVWPGFGYADDLSVHYSAPEYLQHRELVLYADEATAREAFDNIVTATTQCPREESRDGEWFSLWDVETQPDKGDRRSAWVTRTGGQRRLGVMLGGSVYHVVQQGNAVLLLYATGEVSPWTPGPLERFRSELEAETDQVVDELCVFSEGGCKG